MVIPLKNPVFGRGGLCPLFEVHGMAAERVLFYGAVPGRSFEWASRSAIFCVQPQFVTPLECIYNLHINMT